jgi:hypothetical protein
MNPRKASTSEPWFAYHGLNLPSSHPPGRMACFHNMTHVWPAVAGGVDEPEGVFSQAQLRRCRSPCATFFSVQCHAPDGLFQTSRQGTSSTGARASCPGPLSPIYRWRAAILVGQELSYGCGHVVVRVHHQLSSGAGLELHACRRVEDCRPSSTNRQCEQGNRRGCPLPGRRRRRSP